MPKQNSERARPIAKKREKELREKADAKRNPSNGFVGKWLRELFAEIDRLRAEYAELSLEADALRRALDQVRDAERKAG